MTPRELELIARLCLVRTGRELDISAPESVSARLNTVARREGYSSIADLLLALRTSEAERLVWPLIEALTVFERTFMEGPTVLRQLGQRVIPTLAATRRGEPLRIWCAASGAGQEPYSLAISVLEAAAQRGQDLKVEIYASDVSVRALERARTGVFSHFEVQKGLSARRLVDHFQRKDDAWQAPPALRGMVRWRRVNLLAEGPGSARFDVVLCRGILPRTATQMRPALVLNLYNALAPDGVLAVGQGEGEGPADLAPALNVLPGMDGLFSPNPDFRLAA
ncbi:MAG: CheR family methyltransferase [Phenylobacterium sp.]|jgi:chemotaxis protein methyltransferase CheR